MHNQSNDSKDNRSIGGLLRHATLTLKSSGCSNPFLDAGLLIAHVLETSREYVLGHKEHELSDEQLYHFSKLLGRRSSREPMSHLLGYREFYGYQFHVTKDTLDPRPDSEVLIDAVLQDYSLKNDAPNILDLGVGSGCLLLSLLKEIENSKGVGVDVSEQALEVARKNAALLDLESRSRFLKSNWLESVEGTFDIVVANPPYISFDDLQSLEPEVRLYEPEHALTDYKDGFECYRLIAKSLKPHVNKDTFIYYEIGQGQEQDIVSIMELENFVLIEQYKDLAGIIRCLVFHHKNEK
ncbi:MAG: peptide chain release factor N(5)-glutamine methyltransferase [Rickettsiales bacterium]|nr:peptide chain release factor N(5)-glutamine methyltransferase [Rickettsiales bacterium]